MSAVLNVAVVGVGRMGALYCRLILESPRARLVALVGNSHRRTEAVSHRFKVPAYPDGNCEAMWRAHPDIDAVIIATPEWEHLAPALSAAAHGAHILLEKPLAHNLREAEQIAAAVRGSELVFMLCHVLRFEPRYYALYEAVTRGVVGSVRYMYARRNADQGAAGRILARCHPAYWLTPHDVDVMRWVTGAEVTHVQGRAALSGQAPDDCLTVDLRFSNGALGRIDNCWSPPALTGNVRTEIFDVWGSHGVVELSPYESGIHTAITEQAAPYIDTSLAPEVQGRITGAFNSLVDHFLQLGGSGGAFAGPLKDGLATMQVAAAIEQSLRERREVQVGAL